MTPLDAARSSSEIAVFTAAIEASESLESIAIRACFIVERARVSQTRFRILRFSFCRTRFLAEAVFANSTSRDASHFKLYRFYRTGWILSSCV
jgi:hypothetical protein